MSMEDPLENWLFLDDLQLPPERAALIQAEAHASLDRLTEFLDHPLPSGATCGMFGFTGGMLARLRRMTCCAPRLFIAVCSRRAARAAPMFKRACSA
jgi:hypothetical protein